MDLLESLFSSLLPSDADASIVSAYFGGQMRLRALDFIPGRDDDLDLRTPLHQLHVNGAAWEPMQEQIAGLKRCYVPAKTGTVISDYPVDDYNFAQPVLAGGTD
jgi:hypothetical protein